MRAPRFWHQNPGLRSALLWPLSVVYAAGTAQRLARGAKHRPGIPVICVGNLTAGGAGKTPTVIWLVECLLRRGRQPVVLSRGYGGRIAGPHRVDPRKDSAHDVGDEPLLHAAFAPVWVSRDRGAGARAAADDGDVIVMDDGFQNGDVAKDLSIVVVDAALGWGNGRVIPAGPLREPLRTGLGRADLLLSVGPETAQQAFAAPTAPPRVRGSLKPLETGMDWSGLRVVAFAGIAHPDRFFATLRELRADIVSTHGLDDHQPLSPALMQRMLTQARSHGARLVTTEKDAVRLPAEFRTEVLTVPVRLAVPDQSAIDEALDGLLRGR